MEFEDNGIGIDEEYLAKVFVMFFRATQNNEGAGLGLYIVQEAIHKLKGNINIKSTINQGTTFRIEIPNYIPQVTHLFNENSVVTDKRLSKSLQ